MQPHRIGRLEALYRASCRGEPLGLVGRSTLRLAAALYHGVTGVHRLLYELGLWRSIAVDLPTVSVGGLTVGGSGKTPTVAWVARHLQGRLGPVAILTRGHGRDTSRWVIEATDSGVTSRTLGDEAAVLAASVPGARIVVGKRRASVARLVHAMGWAGGLVLDDGFQYYRLRRHLDIVVLDLPLTPSRLRPFPLGELRVDLDRLNRAGVVVLTGADRIDGAARTQAMDLVRQRAPGAVLVMASYVPTRLRPVGSGPVQPVEALQGLPVAAMAGLGHPDGFFHTVTAAGASLVHTVAWPDHHRLDPAQVAAAVSEARAKGAQMLLMTAKDERNLPAMRPDSLPLFVVEAVLEPVVEDTGRLEEALDRLVTRWRPGVP